MAETSGKWLMRVPKSIHEDLRAQAKQQGVSLNMYVACLLARAAGAANREAEIVELINREALAHANYEGPCSDGETYERCELETIQANRLWSLTENLSAKPSRCPDCGYCPGERGSTATPAPEKES